MYCEVTGKCILNDFDLATLMDPGTEVPDRKGYERTGTRPFMAMDLLNKEGVMGLIYRRYRHDLESFFWVLVWVGGCVQGGQEKLTDRYEKMVMGTHGDVYEKKTALLMNSASYTTTDDYVGFRDIISDWIAWWKQFQVNMDTALQQHHRRGIPVKEKPAEYFINALVQVVVDVAHPVPMEIDWLSVEVPASLWRQYQERYALRSDSQ
ncbi:other 1 protein kinase [Moniliophthora roreri MCA 2997]|uniref:Other 1 protein kinase n=1 Tax=Moniliophthora roreri (strain MCA 2997) TaxID=1381753 RepID=V2WKJ5_MONRO|nr:other 1 protein kinase [Moniliophthora roreri MCA 2997]